MRHRRRNCRGFDAELRDAPMNTTIGDLRSRQSLLVDEDESPIREDEQVAEDLKRPADGFDSNEHGRELDLHLGIVDLVVLPSRLLMKPMMVGYAREVLNFSRRQRKPVHRY